MKREAVNFGAFQPPYSEDFHRVADSNAQIIEAANEGFFGMHGAFVERLLEANPDFEPGGKHFERLVPLLEAGSEPSEEELFALGVDIGADLVASQTAVRGRFMAYLGAAHYIDLIKIGYAGHAGSSLAKNRLIEFMRAEVCESFPVDQKTFRIFEVINETLHDLRTYEEETGWGLFTWLEVKALAMGQLYRRRLEFVDYMANVPPVANEAQPNPEADEEVAELTRYVLERRTYGIKPAYTKASLGGSWVFYDGESYREEVNSQAQYTTVPPFAALVMHSPKDDFSDLRLGAERLDFGQGSMLVGAMGAQRGIQPDLGLYIGYDGTVSVDPDGFWTIDRLLKDRPGLARAIKAELAANLFDLMTPILKDGQPKPPSVKSLKDSAKDGFDPILDLVAPRIKILRHAANGGGEEESLRTVREHGVVWHIRILPEGWHASPEARANAERCGVKLGPNETFVREHKRGAGDKVLGHRVLKRTLESA